MVETPRWPVLNLFGDYLRYAGGEAKLGELTELMTAFGMEPGTVRVSMSRLRQEGWFTTRRDGRETVYALSDRMLGIFVHGRPRIFRRQEEIWSGRWTMVNYQVPESDRAVREQLRKQPAWTGFGQLSPSTWLAPHDLAKEAKEIASRHGSARVNVLWCGSHGTETARELAARCWDLDSPRRDYMDAFSLFSQVHEQLGPRARPFVEELIGRSISATTEAICNK